MNNTPQKQHLQELGWTYRAAAPVLGVTYQYLCRVCNGERQSDRLTKKILEMPAREEATGKISTASNHNQGLP
jgi:hypothetical protein